MKTIDYEINHWQVYFLNHRSVTKTVKLLTEHQAAIVVPSRKPNHTFLTIVQPPSVIFLKRRWWAFQEENKLWFVGLGIVLDSETNQPKIHGKSGGRYPTDGAVQHNAEVWEAGIPIDKEWFESGNFPHTIAILSTHLFGPEALGDLHPHIKAYGIKWIGILKGILRDFRPDLNDEDYVLQIVREE